MKSSTTSGYYKVRNAAKVFRAVNHELRQLIIEKLQEKELSVTELYVLLRIEQSVCSQQLSILRKAGVVKTRRDGKQIFYTVDNARLDFVILKADELIR